MKIREEIVSDHIRTIEGGQILLTSREWQRHRGSVSFATGQPVLRLIEHLRDGMVYVEVLGPFSFEPGEVIRRLDW